MRSRPGRRLHAVTWVAALLIIAALVVLSVVGKYVMIYEPPQVGWYFGWPAWFAHQHFSRFDDVRPTGPWMDTKYLEGFSPRALIVDLVVGVALVAGVAYSVERSVRRFSTRPQISLKAFLSFTAWVACYAAIEPIWETSSFPVAEQTRLAGTILIYAALAIAWLAVFDVFGSGWTWMKKETDS